MYDKQEMDYQEFDVPYSKEQESMDYKDSYQQQYPPHSQYSEEYHDSYQEPYDDYTAPPTSTGDRRASEVPELSVTTPRGQTKINGYPSSESEYFYPAQDNQTIMPGDFHLSVLSGFDEPV